jgi:hypothetical protein
VNQKARVEVSDDEFDVRATITDGEERERLRADTKRVMPQFGEYEQKTHRQIPVVVLERARGDREERNRRRGSTVSSSA